jgi:hypothetical protein
LAAGTTRNKTDIPARGDRSEFEMKCDWHRDPDLCSCATSHAYSPIRFCGFLSGFSQSNPR